MILHFLPLSKQAMALADDKLAFRFERLCLPLYYFIRLTFSTRLTDTPYEEEIVYKVTFHNLMTTVYGWTNRL